MDDQTDSNDRIDFIQASCSPSPFGFCQLGMLTLSLLFYTGTLRGIMTCEPSSSSVAVFSASIQIYLKPFN